MQQPHWLPILYIELENSVGQGLKEDRYYDESGWARYLFFTSNGLAWSISSAVSQLHLIVRSVFLELGLELAIGVCHGRDNKAPCE